MTKAEFNKMFHGVVGPAYAGADYPAFDKCAINESTFAHELRFKSYDITFDENHDLIHIKWISQAEGDHDAFLREILRCFREALNFDGDIYVDIATRYNEDSYFSYYF